jgi:hypothetical protein
VCYTISFSRIVHESCGSSSAFCICDRIMLGLLSKVRCLGQSLYSRCRLHIGCCIPTRRFLCFSFFRAPRAAVVWCDCHLLQPPHHASLPCCWHQGHAFVMSAVGLDNTPSIATLLCGMLRCYSNKLYPFYVTPMHDVLACQAAAVTRILYSGCLHLYQSVCA